jgi:hypothetical protein
MVSSQVCLLSPNAPKLGAPRDVEPGITKRHWLSSKQKEEERKLAPYDKKTRKRKARDLKGALKPKALADNWFPSEALGCPSLTAHTGQQWPQQNSRVSQSLLHTGIPIVIWSTCSNTGKILGPLSLLHNWIIGGPSHPLAREAVKLRMSQVPLYNQTQSSVSKACVSLLFSHSTTSPGVTLKVIRDSRKVPSASHR